MKFQQITSGFSRFSLYVGFGLPIVGILALLGNHLTGSDFYSIGGYVFLFLATPINLITLLGLMILWGYGKRNRIEGLSNRRFVKIGLILLLAYPTAFICLLAGIWNSSLIRVKILNQSQQEMKIVQLIGPEGWGEVTYLGNIPPGKSFRYNERLKGDGEIKLKFWANKKMYETGSLGSTDYGVTKFIKFSDNHLSIAYPSNSLLGLLGRPKNFGPIEYKVVEKEAQPFLRYDL